MTRSSRAALVPRRFLILVAAALIPALAGCEAGSNAPTLHWHQPSDGVGTVHDKIAIRNVFVLGAPLGATVQTGQSAGLFLAMVNEGAPDRLVSVSAPGTATSVKLPGGSVSLANQQLVLLTGPKPKVILEGLTRPLTGGSTVRLVMNFQNASRLTMNVPVMPQAQYYSTFSPAPSPSPTATPTASPGAHGASPSPTTSPSSTP